MPTTTLYNIIQSELIKKGLNEFVNEYGELILFDNEFQFMTKILKYDEDVSSIVDDLFSNMYLKDKTHDTHFKRTFVNKFSNRMINRQTVDSFKMELLSTFLSHERYINTVYSEVENILTQTTISDQENIQKSDSTNTTDHRQAFADLPQSEVNLDVNNPAMKYANDNTVSKNKQVNKQDNEGITKGIHKNFKLDDMLKGHGLIENIYNIFDQKCFMQVW